MPEVALFLEKYEDHNSIIYFGRSDNGTVRFIYAASAAIDKDGNGYKETNRRLELTFCMMKAAANQSTTVLNLRAKHMEAHCKEQSKVTPTIDEAFSDTMPAAYEDDVRDFIQNSGFFS